MAFARINYFSQALRKASSFQIIFPDAADARKPWAVLYLLHGLSDDDTTWTRRSSIERYVEGYPLVVVMPDGGRGWYTNAKVRGGRNEDDLIQDVLGLVERTFPVRAERAGRAIGGLSMGGYGAVKLGLKHPDLFASVNGHSGAYAITRRIPAAAENFEGEIAAIFGPASERGPEDPFALAAAIDPGKRPALQFDCGEEDFLLEDSREFHQHLDSLEVPHEYTEYPGDHSWEYWDLHVQEAITFHARSLGIEKRA